jgi:hypothetical protein
MYSPGHCTSKKSHQFRPAFFLIQHSSRPQVIHTAETVSLNTVKSAARLLGVIHCHIQVKRHIVGSVLESVTACSVHCLPVEMKT